MLDLLRNNAHKRRIHLSTELFKDLDWFIQFLPHFNGTTIYKKPNIPESEALHLEAFLTGMGGIWHDRVYSAAIPVIPGFTPTIVHLEMLNIIVALHLWGPCWRHSEVKIYCDNEAVVQSKLKISSWVHVYATCG